MKKKHHKMIDIICLLRPQSVILMLLFIYIPILKQTANWREAVLQVFPVYLLLTAEIILNDYMDIDKDIVNKPHRPLASGAVSSSVAIKLILYFILAAIISSFYIYKLFSMRFILFMVVFFILTLYSLLPRQLASVKAFITALVTFLCLSFIFTYSKMTSLFFYYAVVAFFYISSREILMDIRDYEGDRQYQCRTLAVKYGKVKTYWLAVILMIISQILYISKIVIYSNLINKVLWGIALFTILLLFLLFKNSTVRQQNKIAILLWLPMLLTIPVIMI